MKKEVIRTPEAPSSSLYSQAVKVGSMLYLSGTAGSDPKTGQLAGTTIQEQTRQALQNCRAILATAGARLENVVSVLVLLARPADFAGFNEEYARVFPSDPPARAVTRLGVEIPNLLVSISMTAAIPS